MTTLLARSSTFPVVGSRPGRGCSRLAALKSAWGKYSYVTKHVFSQSPNSQVEVYVEVEVPDQVEVEVHQHHCDTSEVGLDLDPAKFDAVKAVKSGSSVEERAEAEAVLRFLSKSRAPAAALRRTLEISSADGVFGPYIQPQN